MPGKKMVHKPQEKIRLISQSNEPFRDRVQAGQLLAEAMKDLKGKKAVVLGIPRGGLVVAREMAIVLEADLDIVLSRKLGTPGQTELAMGALAEDGTYFLNNQVVQMLGITKREIEQEIAHQSDEIKRRSRLIRGTLPKTVLTDRLVVVTDDGAATGVTMQAALWMVHQEKPKKLIAAVPVASEDALNRLKEDADEVICLRLPFNLSAIGQFYYRFDQIEDEEVVEILAEEAARREQRVRNG